MPQRPTTVVQYFQQWAQTRGDQPAIHGKVDGAWRTWTWSEYWGACRDTAKGLIALGVELRIADDGEVLARGRNMTRGYLRMPDKTRNLLDDDGWLHTGDLGELDADGYLKITGRKKDILITAGGKNVAPAEMEGEVRRHHRVPLHRLA